MDLPGSDWGDFSCRRAVDSSSFPRCFANREINQQIILSRALKQFVIRVHTLFSIIGKKYLCHTNHQIGTVVLLNADEDI